MDTLSWTIFFPLLTAAVVLIIPSTWRGLIKAVSLLGAVITLVLAIGLGLIVNLAGVPVPGALSDAVALMARAALPAALFGLGGVLVRYRPEGDIRIVLYICAVSLILHPAVTWGMGKATGLSTDAFRSAVLTASMAPGVNTFIFASMYGVAKRVAATSVLVGTAASMLSIWIWLTLLP